MNGTRQAVCALFAPERVRIEPKLRRASEYHLGVVGWVLVDTACAVLAVIAACWLSPSVLAWRGMIDTDPHFSPGATAVIYGILFSVVSHVFGLHNPLMRRDTLVLTIKCVCVAILSVTLLALIELFFLYSRVGRYVLLYTFTMSAASTVLLRLGLWRLSEEGKRRIVVLGSDDLADDLEGLVRKSGVPYEVVPLERVNCALEPDCARGEHPLGCVKRSQGLCRKCGVHEIIACYTPDTPRNELLDLSQSLLSGVRVSDYSTFVERTFFKVPAEQISAEWFFQINTSPDYALYRAAKRLADILLATFGLLVAGPILLLAMVLVRFESPGPAFYSQVRVGQYNRLFRIWKLRSMRNGAENNGAQWARKNDPRVTRIGRLLRLTRLDEAPQFFNVLAGDMSLIGPRPEQVEFVRELAQEIPFYQQRHLMKPGITGWAQINYPYGATAEDALNKLKYDLYYLKYASPLLDLQIILRTIGAVMKGAR